MTGFVVDMTNGAHWKNSQAVKDKTYFINLA